MLRQGTYRKYFIIYISFFLALSMIIVPLATLSLRALEEETLQTAREVLTGGLRRLETELDNVYQIGMTLYNDPDFYKLVAIAADTVSPPADLVNLIDKIKQENKNLSSMLSLTSDFGMVLPNSVVLSSSRVHMPTEAFYGAYLKAEPYETMAEWKEAIKRQATNHVLFSMPVSSFTGSQLSSPVDSVVFAIPLPLNGNWNTFCYAVFSVDTLSSTLALREMREKGALTLTEADGNILIEQSADTISNAVYIEAKSEVYSFIARMSINRDYFLSQMQGFTRMVQIVLGIYLLVGIALVMIYTRRNAKPMMRMMNAASAVSASADIQKENPSDAYAYMEGFIQQVDSRLRENRLALANQEILIKENLMERMLRQQLYFSSSQEMARTYFPDFPLPCQMILIKLDESSRINDLPPQAFSDLQVKLRRIVSQHVSPKAILHFTAGSLVVMQEVNGSLAEISLQIISEIENELGLDSRACVSLPFEKMDEMDQVFLRLRHILRFASLARVVTEEKQDQPKAYEGIQYATRFYEMLSRGRLQQALDALNAELESFKRNGNTDENSVQQLFFHYRLLLCQVAQYGNLSLQDASLPAYDAAASLDQLFDGIRASAEAVCGVMNQRAAQAYSEQENEILAAINAQLANPTLGIEAFMEQFALSEKNVQRLMRNATGMTFFEYLNHQRMEKAKQMLEKTDVSIQNISAECGYASINTFYKAFQRAFSTTPNAMRKNAQKE